MKFSSLPGGDFYTPPLVSNRVKINLFYFKSMMYHATKYTKCEEICIKNFSAYKGRLSTLLFSKKERDNEKIWFLVDMPQLSGFHPKELDLNTSRTHGNRL